MEIPYDDIPQEYTDCARAQKTMRIALGSW